MSLQSFRQPIKSTVAIILAGSLAACAFEPDLVTLQFPTAPPQAFGEFSQSTADSAESTEQAVLRLRNELFDPFNLGPGLTYDGSVYELADQILAGAYEYYGYDLASLAATGRDNPITEQMFLDYLSAEGVTYIVDPASGEEFSVFQWLQSRVREAANTVHPTVIREIPEMDPLHRMNYERNFLAAVMSENPFPVIVARKNFNDHLIELFGDDAVATFQYLEQLDAFGTE